MARQLWLAALAMCGASARLPSAFDLKQHSKNEFDYYRQLVEAEKAGGKPLDVPPPPQSESHLTAQAAEVSPPAPLDKAKSQSMVTGSVGMANVPPPPVPRKTATSARGVRKALLPRSLQLGVPVVALAGAFFFRSWRAAKLARLATEAWQRLKESAGSAGGPIPPLPHGIAARRELIASLERRIAAIRDILPVYSALEAKPPSDLWEKTEGDIDALRVSLNARVDACGQLLDLHEKLGQSPPKGFRTWKLSNITDYVVNLQSRMPLLQRAILLHAQLGQSRVDMSMVDWSNGQLEAHTASLAAQVEQTRARRERDQLLGKVEAALWRKDPEADPPMGLSTMTTSELQEVLAKLNGERTPNPKADKS